MFASFTSNRIQRIVVRSVNFYLPCCINLNLNISSRCTIYIVTTKYTSCHRDNIFFSLIPFSIGYCFRISGKCYSGTTSTAHFFRLIYSHLNITIYISCNTGTSEATTVCITDNTASQYNCCCVRMGCFPISNNLLFVICRSSCCTTIRYQRVNVIRLRTRSCVISTD